MALRAIPSHLCMAEAVPFGQRWNYHTPHPVDAVLDETYFSPVKHMFKPGDEIRVCRVENNRVKAFLDLMVAEVHQKTVEIHQISQITNIPARDKPETAVEGRPAERYVTGDADVQWKGPQKKWTVYDAGKEVADRIDDKEVAWRIAKGDIPVPEAA